MDYPQLHNKFIFSFSFEITANSILSRMKNSVFVTFHQILKMLKLFLDLNE
jgi:hypothetical protein